MKINLVLLLMVLYLSIPCGALNTYAQQNELSNTMRLKDENAMPEATLADVSWIAGHWQGEMFGGTAEEIWSPPFGNSMMGMYKLVVNNTVTFYELMIIVEESNSLVLKLKHFDPGLTSWEEKDENVKFPLVEYTHHEIYFDGLTFKLVDDNTLQVYLRVKQDDDRVSEVPFQYHRVTE